MFLIQPRFVAVCSQMYESFLCCSIRWGYSLSSPGNFRYWLDHVCLKPQRGSLDFSSYLILQRLCIKITNLKWRISYCMLSMHLNFSFVIHHMYSSVGRHVHRPPAVLSTYKHANFQSDCINYYATSCSLSAQVFVSLHGNNVVCKRCRTSAPNNKELITGYAEVCQVSYSIFEWYWEFGLNLACWNNQTRYSQAELWNNLGYNPYLNSWCITFLST